jgi:hypothetical protein
MHYDGRRRISKFNPLFLVVLQGLRLGIQAAKGLDEDQAIVG